MKILSLKKTYGLLFGMLDLHISFIRDFFSLKLISIDFRPLLNYISLKYSHGFMKNVMIVSTKKHCMIIFLA
jgi:hypothetical protein